MFIEFVDSYKAKNPYRMQWQKGVQEGKIVTYGYGNSIKRKYESWKKQLVLPQLNPFLDCRYITYVYLPQGDIYI